MIRTLHGLLTKIINLINKKNIPDKSYIANDNTNKLKTSKSFQNNLTLPTPCNSESCIKSNLKSNLNFYFNTSLWCLKKLLIKLLHSKTSSKAYWSILKSFLNDKKSFSFPHYTTVKKFRHGCRF